MNNAGKRSDVLTGRGHKAVDKQCSVHLQQKEANILVAQEGITYYEARHRVHTLHKIQLMRSTQSYAEAVIRHTQSIPSNETRSSPMVQATSGSRVPDHVVQSTLTVPT